MAAKRHGGLAPAVRSARAGDSVRLPPWHRIQRSGAADELPARRFVMWLPVMGSRMWFAHV